MIKIKIIFLHIPKAAGTTLIHIAKSQYPDGVLHYNTVIDNFDVIQPFINNPFIYFICGHFPYGFHYHVNTPTTYVTLLRNPVSRIVSEYHYLLMTPIHDPYVSGKIRDENMSLKDYVYCNDPKFIARTSNVQTRLISGQEIADLSVAKANLLRHFSVIGTSERFNEFLFLMHHRFKWKIGRYARANRTIYRSNVTLSKEVLHTIISKNQLDIQLYKFANDHLNKAIHSLPYGDKCNLYAYLKRNNV